MEETLATAAIDLSGRYSWCFEPEFPPPKIGEFDSELVEDFWQAVAANAPVNLHVSCTTAATATTSAKPSSKPPPGALRNGRGSWTRADRACPAPRARWDGSRQDTLVPLPQLRAYSLT